MSYKETCDLIFDLCTNRSNQFVYADSYIHIQNGGVVDVEWSNIVFGFYNEDELTEEIGNHFHNVPDIKDGYYLLRALYTIETDYDDYRSWNYLELTEYKLEFQTTVEEMFDTFGSADLTLSF